MYNVQVVIRVSPTPQRGKGMGKERGSQEGENLRDRDRGGRVDYNIKCNTKKYGHHTHFRVKCNYHKTKGTEVEYEVLYTFYTI